MKPPGPFSKRGRFGVRRSHYPLTAMLAAAAVAWGGALSWGGERREEARMPGPDSPVDHSEEAAPAIMRVRGYGLLGNRQLGRMLALFTDADPPPTYFNATQIEDAALILIARVREDGYLRPRVEARLTLEDGSIDVFDWDLTRLTQLPRPMRAVRVEFEIERGILYHYRELDFEGLGIMDPEETRGYFLPTGFLFETKRMRTFTPDRLERSMGNLREVLVRAGHEKAAVWAAAMEQDDETGAVDVVVGVKEGSLSLVRSARVEILPWHTEAETEHRYLDLAGGQPFSRIWAQDTAQELRREQFILGFPDADVEVEVVHRDEAGEEEPVKIDLLFRVRRGAFIEIGEIEFRGYEKTQEKILRRRVPLKTGQPLNPLEVDQARFRLARLGSFSSVEVDYEDAGDGIRNVVYRIVEGRKFNVNLLGGYGSYEMLRGGIEMERFNVFGRAHRSRLLLVQSMRSSSGSYTHRVPELFGEELHGFGEIFGLRREEISFDREEYGGSFGVQAPLRGIKTEAGIRYTLQELQSRNIRGTERPGLEKARVASLGLDLNRDLRDNPVYPEKGHSHHARLELAAGFLGGKVDYQRLELGGSHHWPLGGGRFLRAGLQHGIINTFGAVESDIPFNRRFFLGGENTVRGYLQGEASPVNAAGDSVGSETYTLLNLEFEQALTPRWSWIFFVDAIGFARDIADYPFNEELASIGTGIRYKTIIGPIRLEYGHNLNPRRTDPRGSLHLSIGFPF